MKAHSFEKDDECMCSSQVWEIQNVCAAGCFKNVSGSTIISSISSFLEQNVAPATGPLTLIEIQGHRSPSLQLGHTSTQCV